ncbi:hypothetical protein [Streptomyces zagrosensis]|uniref:Uncharacterized protein n=1 Tax=Streptomyces zagrosensis TaxID=1042984 RepID=A0A7W9V3J7_9ACTN|nr:hypothetical protein [Streptomyces zagrosensis]MBB5939974.1 hypothetical protein [Streptomyces zagrosensis]
MAVIAAAVKSQFAGLGGLKGFELAFVRDGPVIDPAGIVFAVRAAGLCGRGLSSIRLGQEMAVREDRLGEPLVGRVLS